ncbi:MAG: hypothetical protein KF878_17325 [Planctomycetes bacterium]|nr:hypothetical protein [Planctomycetota bacterium]
MPAQTCFRHTRRASDYRCQQCGRPICERCIVNARFCSKECNGRYTSFIADYDRPTRRPGVSPWRALLALLLTAAVVGGLVYARERGWLPRFNVNGW